MTGGRRSPVLLPVLGGNLGATEPPETAAISLRPFGSNRVLLALVAWLVLVWVVTAIAPRHPRDWLLENLLVFVWCGLLAVTFRAFRFSNLSYALFTAFMTLHLAGAHYTYSETPAGDWMAAEFGFDRNHYDRVVHFAFGLLLAVPMRELLLCRSGLRVGWSYFVTLCCVLAFSAFYELLEAIAAMIVDPELGTAFLGTQGDEWDAQKDSAVAFAGALIAMGLAWWLERLRSVATRKVTDGH